MPGCPSCGSDRLKGAPLPLVSPIAEMVLSRRRYRCSDCSWSGWKHRLRRIGKPTSLVDPKAPEARAIWFFVVLIALLVTAAVLLLRSCSWERAPTPEGNGGLAAPAAQAARMARKIVTVDLTPAD
jgi:hypothetical protein